MYQRIVVPVDGSADAWRAVSPAFDLAERWDCPLCVVSIVRYDFEVDQARTEIDSLLGAAGWHERAEIRVIDADHSSVGEHVSAVVDEQPGSLVVMSSTGRGRSAALIGSVAETILRHISGPVLIYGPHAKAEAPTGRPIVVAITAQHGSEASLGPAGAWAIGLDATPWVVTVGDPKIAMPPDAAEWALASTRAEELSKLTDRNVEFETLHDDHPARALVEFATSIGAGMLVEATHAREGFKRFVAGSVSMKSVREATCPVLVVRSFGDAAPGAETIDA